MLSFTYLQHGVPLVLECRLEQNVLISAIEAPPPTPLRKAMAELGIRPFKREGISQYKKRTLYRLEFLAWIFPIAKYCFVILGTIAGIFGMGLFFAGAREQSFFLWIFTPAVILFLVSASVILHCHLKRVPAVFAGTVWFLQSIDMLQDVPEYVADMQIRLLAKCPEARFYADCLHLDPLLLVRDGHGTEEYIAAWDAPGFNVERVP